MFGLEESYRGIPFDTQYSAFRRTMGKAKADSSLADGKFSIPKNVYIIGTMNDIDRSVEAFDFARRFGLNEHYHIGPAYIGKTKKTALQEAKDEIWALRIEPLLREYVRGNDVAKVKEFIEDCNKAFFADSATPNPAGEQRWTMKSCSFISTIFRDIARMRLTPLITDLLTAVPNIKL